MATTKKITKFTTRMDGSCTKRVAMVMLANDSDGFVGRIDFYPDSVELKPDYLWNPNDDGDTSIILSMPVSRFQAVLSMLDTTHERSMTISVDQPNGTVTYGTGYVQSGDTFSVSAMDKMLHLEGMGI